MENTIEIAIPIAAEIAKEFNSPARREAAGCYLSDLMRNGGLRKAPAEALTDAKRQARANGLTDAEIELDLEIWRSEGKG